MKHSKASCKGRPLDIEGKRYECPNCGEPCILKGEFGDTLLWLCSECVVRLTGMGWTVVREFPREDASAQVQNKRRMG